jgi:regulatory protein
MGKTGSQKESTMAESELYSVLLNKAMSLCAAREMCFSDMMKKLKAWGAGDKEADSILRHLEQNRFIDEKRFTLAFTRDKFRYNKWGKVKIAHALKLKNVPGNIIKESLGAIDEEAYLETLNFLITQHRKKIRAKNQYDLKGKLLRYGLSKGFESHLIYDLLSEEY